MNSKELVLQNLFAIKLYSTYLNNINTNKLKTECYYIKDNILSERNEVRSRVGGWQSADIIYEYVKNDKQLEEYNKLLANIQDVLNSITTRYKCKLLNISNIWININQKNHYNNNHIHPGSPLSGVFYVNIPKDSNSAFNIVRDSYYEDTTYCEWIKSSEELIDLSDAEKISLTPQDNLLLLFPGFLRHGVDPNLSAEDRISISFNTKVQ